MARQPGDKLGPRLVSLGVQHTMALRRQLAPVEAKIAAAATQELIDRAGEEIAGLWRPITRKVLAAHGDAMPAELAHMFTRMESGQHQWEAIAGNLQMASTSAFSSVLSNYLFTVTGPLNSLAPSLPVDAQTGAAAAAAGLATYDAAVGNAAAWGNTPQAASIMYHLAQSIPGGPQLYQLVNRGLISSSAMRGWLQRAALPAELIDAVAQLATQILDPSDAALAVLRGNMTQAAGYQVAKANGLTDADFDILIGNTGEPLALEEMLLLWRWGKMDTPTLEKGIRQSRVRDEWIPYAEMLGIVPPSGAEIIDALVRGQISHSEAVTRWKIAGGDPTWFETAYTSNANPPSPTQLAELANRGIIPWTGTGPTAISYQQGIYEGDTKDKWEPYTRQLAVYHPPPREIATLVREGGITQDQAVTLWEQAGMTPELAHTYWVAAHYQKTSSIHALAQGEIIKLYQDRAVTRDQAKTMLESVRWTADDAEWLLDIADLSVERALLEKAIAKIGALYIGHKITGLTAAAALHTLELPASQVTALQATWDLERGANLKVLTAGEIADAWYYQLISPEDAQAELEAIGYTPHDAWLILNIKNKGPIQNYPDPGGK